MSLSDRPAEHLPSPLIADRVVGALVGLAIGDALGAPIEWMTRAEIAAAHPSGVRDFLANPARRILPGQVTDDTDMAFVTAESLIARRGLDMADLAVRLPAWGQSRTDLGATTLAGLAALRAGVNWMLAGSEKDPSSGCLPRCAPVALVVPLHRVASDTADCCRATHRHPLAIASCVVQNLLVARLVRRESWAQATDTVTPCQLGAEFEVAWGTVVRSLAHGAPAANGAPAVLAEAYLCVNDAPDAEAAMVAAVSLGGDTDTRGAVAGLLAGTRWGIAALPNRWLAACPAVAAAGRLAVSLASTGVNVPA